MKRVAPSVRGRCPRTALGAGPFPPTGVLQVAHEGGGGGLEVRDERALGLYARVRHLAHLRRTGAGRRRPGRDARASPPPDLSRVADAAKLQVWFSGGRRARLARVELRPRAAMELGVEGGDVLRADEVDEGVPDVALVPEVDGQVHEVELACAGRGRARGDAANVGRIAAARTAALAWLVAAGGEGGRGAGGRARGRPRPRGAAPWPRGACAA